MVAMPGWLRRATVIASAWNRLAISGSFSSAFRTLMATSRWSVSSIARYTVPMPPRPMRSSTRYLPMFWPTIERSGGSLGLRKEPCQLHGRLSLDRVHVEGRRAAAQELGSERPHHDLVANPVERVAGDDDLAGLGDLALDAGRG